MCFLDSLGAATIDTWKKSEAWILLFAPCLLLLSPGLQAGLKPLPICARLWPDVPYSSHANGLCQCCCWPWHGGFLLSVELLSTGLCLYWKLLLESVFTVMVAKWIASSFSRKILLWGKVYSSEPPSVQPGGLSAHNVVTTTSISRTFPSSSNEILCQWNNRSVFHPPTPSNCRHFSILFLQGSNSLYLLKIMKNLYVLCDLFHILISHLWL